MTIHRRDLLRSGALGAGALIAGTARVGALQGQGGVGVGAPIMVTSGNGPGPNPEMISGSGRVQQSVARWCFEGVPLPELCAAAVAMGLPAIDLLEVDEWAVAADHGLVASVGMVGAGSIENGLNDPANHDDMVRAFEVGIPLAAEAGVPNVICFFGNRRGMGDERAIENSVRCLERCAPIAESYGVTILVELLNSKVSHPDYIGDRTEYGVRIIDAVSSARVKLLYDIYHMQVMEGDVIRTIRDNHAHIAHYHTGGVPGRAEIDNTQELNYVGITSALADLGFGGYMAHEFIPRGPDPLASLRAAVRLCDV